jgi:hypothetical protein
MEALMDTQGDAFVHDFAFQVPIWVAVVTLLAVGFGVWKLAKVLWAVMSD